MNPVSSVFVADPKSKHVAYPITLPEKERDPALQSLTQVVLLRCKHSSRPLSSIPASFTQSIPKSLFMIPICTVYLCFPTVQHSDKRHRGLFKADARVSSLVLDYPCITLCVVNIQVLNIVDFLLCSLSAAWSLFFAIALLCTFRYRAAICSFISISFCEIDPNPSFHFLLGSLTHVLLGLVIVAVYITKGYVYAGVALVLLVGILIQFVSMIVMIVTWIRRCRIPSQYHGILSGMVTR